MIDHFGNAVLAFLQEEAAPWGRERLWRVSEYRVQPHRRAAGASQSHGALPDVSARLRHDSLLDWIAPGIPRAGNQTNSRIQVRHRLHHGAGLDGVVAVMSVTAL
ncbi:hypothetical protein [Burkholderia gladioli]|uniref:hypothetical protein n=1 Tax=Burkholderia gladioli TaxID=28095 RepID=UPI00163E460C|nr:hypothetical protein [Burkholderia gladioli]MBU9641409.1 hypothetical protein [Burkholderia gladioli]